MNERHQQHFPECASERQNFACDYKEFPCMTNALFSSREIMLAQISSSEVERASTREMKNFLAAYFDGYVRNMRIDEEGRTRTRSVFLSLFASHFLSFARACASSLGEQQQQQQDSFAIKQ
jgi:hypothetical protein